MNYGSSLRLQGYLLDINDEAIALRLFTSARRGIYAGLGYTLQLIDQIDAYSIASQREPAQTRANFWMLKPGAQPLYPHAMTLAIPRDAPTERAHWITLTLWRDEDGDSMTQPILSSELPQLEETAIILGELVLPAMAES